MSYHFQCLQHVLKNTSLADLNLGICFRKFDMPYSYFYYPAT